MSFSSTTSISIPRLRDSFDGRVVVPGDPGYDQARKVFYGKFDRRPAAVVRPSNAAEVARVVVLAAETGVELAVRRRAQPGRAQRQRRRIVLDLADMHALDIDAEGRTAWAETADRRGLHRRRRRPRAGHRVRRHRVGRDRRADPGGRDRVPGPKARPDHRQPAGGRGGHRRRAGAAHRRRQPSRPVLGDPGRWWELRGGHPPQVPAARAGRSSAGCCCCRAARR